MNIKIIIDNREAALYNEIIERDLDKYTQQIHITKETLDLGDIHISFPDKVYVFERKNVPDLLSSIKDGRYKEQKARLLSNIHLQHLTYIIEGDNVVSTMSYNNNKSVLLGAYFNTLFRDNIRVLFTKNVSETVTLILSLAAKIIDNPDKFSTSNISSSDYTDNLKLKRKKIDNIDVRSCYIMQLSQIPHISNVIAKNIASIYPTFRDLIYALDACDTEDKKIQLLCAIDKIGKEKAKNIIQFLLV
jgi:ERCC4-type nuclease